MAAGNRGLANQALFQAGTLLDAWDYCQSTERYGGEQLALAFRPAVLLHLQRAYGWFLLAVAGLDAQTEPRQLPTRADEVPRPPQGREPAPELREFALLERDGWLGDMLAADAPDATPDTPRRDLLSSDRRAVTSSDLRSWANRLQAVMQRMDDSLAEC